MLPKQHVRIFSKVIEMGDIKIAHMPFKEGKLDITPTIVINVNM